MVVSLLYVAVQLRQNTKAIVASSRQGALHSEVQLVTDYMVPAVDPHLIDDEARLSPENERWFTWLIVKALRIRESAWRHFEAGTLDEESWQSYMAPAPGVFSSNRTKAVLAFYVGSPEFMQIIRDKLAESEANTPKP